MYMTKKTFLQIILIIALGGMIFSGYLSYQELFAGTCNVGFVRCGSSFQLMSLPACVYGLIMYTLVVIISFLGLKAKK